MGYYVNTMCERMGETERRTEREIVLMVQLRDKWTYLIPTFHFDYHSIFALFTGNDEGRVRGKHSS